MASPEQWVTNWVGKASHYTRSAAKLLTYKQNVPTEEQYDIVLM